MPTRRLKNIRLTMDKFFTIFKNVEDLSLKLKSFATPSIPFELLASDYLYVGFEKFFRSF